MTKSSLYLLLLTSLVSIFSTTSALSGGNGASNNICGSVLGSTEQLRASDAYACLISTPFRPDVARELLDYWKTTLKFQSTLAYLRDPPSSYQQPSVDLLRGLDLIRAQIDTGVFANQYAFEAAVQNLLFAAHDGTVFLAGSVMGVFTFGAPVNLVSVSADGLALPQVYVATDLVDPVTAAVASPVMKINGESVEDFLAVFASQNSFGYLEPHSDWNGLMWSAAKAQSGFFGSITQTIFYPGDTFTAEFANGTKVGPLAWRAYNVQGRGKSALQTGEDFYNYFVLGIAPVQNPSDSFDDYDVVAALGTTPPPPTVALTGWGGAYPEVADIAQNNLGDGGTITGYFLNDSSTGVLSIPSFQLTDEAYYSFSATIAEFLQRSKQAGMKRVVIDLQQNFGGSLLLATDAFRQFFPGIEPFSGMRTRSFGLSNEIGNAFTSLLLNDLSSLNASFVQSLGGNPFAVVSDELNAETNANFTSWQEYYGPRPDRNDAFSTVFRYNLSSLIFDQQDTGGITLDGVGNRSVLSAAPFDAADIVILTDGACSGACDVFVEMMHHEAGVRTVAVGGLPQYGPMQARGASRSAQTYSSDDLDSDMQTACAINQTLCSILPNRVSEAKDQSRLTFGFFDQIRSRENVPLQFVYEPADCRIFWTVQSFYDYVALWQHAAEATFHNGSMCVPRSLEHDDTMRTNVWGPSAEQKASWASTNPAWVARDDNSISAISALAQRLYDGSINQNEKRDGTGSSKHPGANKPLGSVPPPSGLKPQAPPPQAAPPFPPQAAPPPPQAAVAAPPQGGQRLQQVTPSQGAVVSQPGVVMKVGTVIQSSFQALSNDFENLRDAVCHSNYDCGANTNYWACVPGWETCGLTQVPIGRCKPLCLGTTCGWANAAMDSFTDPACGFPGTPSCPPTCFCNKQPTVQRLSAVCLALAQDAPVPVVTAVAGAPYQVDIDKREDAEALLY